MKEWSLRGWYSVVCAGTHSKGNWPFEAQEVQKNRSWMDMKANVYGAERWIRLANTLFIEIVLKVGYRLTVLKDFERRKVGRRVAAI